MIRTLAAYLLLTSAALGVDYPVLYLEQPATDFPVFGETDFIDSWVPGTDLKCVHPDGRVETIVDSGLGAVLGYAVSFDGTSIVYALAAPSGGSRLYLWTGNKQITDDEWLQHSTTKWPIMDLSPCWVDADTVMFSTNRNGFQNPKFPKKPSYQLATIDIDGRNLRIIGHHNFAAGVHPVAMTDGSFVYASDESFGWKNGWAQHRINADGSGFGPVTSNMRITAVEIVQHFGAQKSDGRYVFIDYYSGRKNLGYGPLHEMFYPPAFGSPKASDNPKIRYGVVNVGSDGKPRYEQKQYPYQVDGLRSLTPEVIGRDKPAFQYPAPNGFRVGKLSHPGASPNNGVLLSWSGQSKCHLDSGIDDFNSCIVLIPNGGEVLEDMRQLVKIVDDPDGVKVHEFAPAAWVPYERIHGIKKPATPKPDPVFPDDQYAYILTPDVLHGECEGLNDSAPWNSQGSTATTYRKAIDEGRIRFMRILIQEPVPAEGAAPHFGVLKSQERVKIGYDIPIPKNGGPVKYRLPKNQVHSHALMSADANGENKRTESVAQGWLAGSLRCFGCHNHDNPIDDSHIDWASVPIVDITGPPRTVEYERDVKPILSRCYKCHSGDKPEGGLNLDQHPREWINYLNRKANTVIIPYAPTDSPLMQRLDAGTMPPADSGVSITAKEREIIADWIGTGCQIGPAPDADFTAPSVRGDKYADLYGIDRVEDGKVFDTSGNWAWVEYAPAENTLKAQLRAKLKEASELVEQLP